MLHTMDFQRFKASETLLGIETQVVEVQTLDPDVASKPLKPF